MYRALPLIFLILSGCGIVVPICRSESKLSKLSLDQDKQEVIRLIGNPSVVRGAKKLENGISMEVSEYRLYSKNAWWIDAVMGIPLLTMSWWIPFSEYRSYWLQYENGKLAKWGKAGDWQPDVTVDATVRNK